MKHCCQELATAVELNTDLRYCPQQGDFEANYILIQYGCRLTYCPFCATELKGHYGKDRGRSATKPLRCCSIMDTACRIKAIRYHRNRKASPKFSLERSKVNINYCPWCKRKTH